MKLDRNANEDGRGKYGVINLRKVQEINNDGDEIKKRRVREALRFLLIEGILDYGVVGSESEFFLIKLRDVNAHAALSSYAASVLTTPLLRPNTIPDAEYYTEILEMAGRAGPLSKFCKNPD